MPEKQTRLDFFQISYSNLYKFSFVIAHFFLFLAINYQKSNNKINYQIIFFVMEELVSKDKDL